MKLPSPLRANAAVQRRPISMLRRAFSRAATCTRYRSVACSHCCNSSGFSGSASKACGNPSGNCLAKSNGNDAAIVFLLPRSEALLLEAILAYPIEKAVNNNLDRLPLRSAPHPPAILAATDCQRWVYIWYGNIWSRPLVCCPLFQP